MPALKFKTCRLLSGNVWKRKLYKIQRRILLRLRRRGKSIKRHLLLFMRKNRNSNIKLQTLRKLSLAREKRRIALYHMCDILMGISHTRECVPRRWSRVFPKGRPLLK